MACRSDHQRESAGRPLTHTGGRPRGDRSIIDLRLWLELQDRTSSREMPTASRACVTDRCHCGGANADVRRNAQLSPIGCDPMRCSRASLSVWLTSIRDEIGLLKPVAGVHGRSGQPRPYVRPAARHLPLAIMGVRMRVRRHSPSRARGTPRSAALPETASLAVLPITLFSACCRIDRACARRLPCALAHHAVAAAAGATPPFAR